MSHKYFTVKTELLTIEDLINEEKIEREREWERKGNTFHHKARKPKRDRNLNKVARRQSRDELRSYLTK